MEVATVTKTNNHNHSNFHHPEQQRMPSHHSHNGLSVGLISNGTGSANDAGGARSPFQREVREWQHIDPDTGALLTGRLEADRWINGPMNSYGKISDSQNISQPNGTQHTQRKQLEVLQARTATGAMQVIRAQTVQKTSSRWSSSTSTTTTSASTSASSSAVASPTIMRSLTANGSKTKHNHLNKPHFRSNHLIPPFLPQVSTLDNCRVSNSHSSSSRSSSDAEIDANDVDNDDVTGNVVKGNNNSTDRLSFLNNGHKNINGSNFSLLLDTAPSLKLSNLMKSNSSLSSDNSSSNNSTATSTKNNTHHIKSAAGKISLHSIVGGGENMRRTTATSTSTSTTTTLPSSSSSSLSTTTILSPLLTKTTSAMNWQQSQQQRSSRLFDQPTLYGKDSQRQSLTKSRVGVNDVEAGAVNDYDAGDDGVSITPTQLKSRQQQQDLESFRHYNEHQSTSTSTSTSTPTSIALPSANVVNRGNDDDEVLSLTEGHHRRQKDQSYDASTQIQRTRSISTDDLSTEWDEHEDNDNQESGEWRRVSKLRRSFQSSSNSKAENSTYPRKPIDLPSNSISVARIRAELENGRRLNTAMRNNHVDLAALDTILNGTGESSKSMPEQRNSFLTAESLKEIRAGLKKLSDESLYRDDYVPAMQNAAPDEQIEIQDVKKPPERIRTCQLMAEKSTEIAPTKSAFQVFTRTIPNLSSPTSYITQHSLPTGGLPKHTTHSLESRQKSKDSTSSIDWHLRRKSYGFEKMTPQDDKSVFRMDASTDSGLGRSGEQLGNWSPTESNNPSSLTTVIHFGETSKAVANTAKPIVKRRYHQPKTSETNESGLKRHSIAVDESQYVRDNARKTSQIHLKGYYDRSIDTSMNSLQPTRLLDSTETPINTTSSSNVLFQRNTSQQKRVEFCKTEVHFAAESGRVNIVETDGKPPPTNNFRRRRRTTSGPLQTLLTSSSTAASDSTNIPRSITLFGEQNETKVIASSTVAYKASLAESLSDKDPATTNVTFSTPKVLGNTFTHLTSSRSSYTSTSGVDTTDGETDEISAIRGILKNKPIKPKPYHLGENIENADALWGVQLKPIGGTVKHDFTKSSSPPSMASASVAERVRIVEQRQDNASISQTNGYSTKINLSLSDDPKVWSDTTGSAFINDNAYYNVINSTSLHRRPSLQEIMLQDLREHQRILDEGLKSTSLIIKTMRSANEFDEAMRRLSIASEDSPIIPPIVIPTPMLRSHSYQGSTRRTSITSFESNENGIVKSATKTTTTTSSSSSSSSLTVRQSSNDMTSKICKTSPVATPRLKLLGNTKTSVSQQLTQLRRMYELAAANATSQDEDSADEEVKRYFKGHQQNESSDSGGGTQESSSLEDEKFIEYSSSWSRLKAKRTIWRIGSYESNKQLKTLESTELPKSNVMSIELHSPQTSLEGKDATQSIETMPPVAKQRTVMSAKHTELPQLHTTTTLKQTTDDPTNKEKNRDFLKIVKETRGARKLREHELSYFGVQAPKDNEKDVKSTYTGTQLRSLKRNLPQRKTNDDDSKPNRHAEWISETTKQQKATNWQLLNDKPDLLKHNPITVEPHPITNATAIVPMERKSLKKPLTHDDENNEHIYENIATEIKTEFKVQSPTRMLAKTHDEYSSYNRKTDHKRDAMILNEMTENADQTLKAISDGAAIKDQRRRSLHRRSSKPLETINEKTIAEKINDKCIAVQITRGTLASDAKRSYRHKIPSPTKLSSRFRSSSTSSNEGCSCARSRSLSSECEYENIKLRPKRISTSATRSKTSKLSNRSSLQDSEHTTTGHCCSSGDDEMITRRERLRNSSSKAKLVLNSDTQKQSSKESMRQRDKMQFSPIGKSQRRGDDLKKRTSSSTAHSSRRERAECNDEVKTHNSRDNHGKQHHSTESSSSRRHKDNTSSSSTKGKLVERQERDRTHSSSTRCIDHSYHGNTQQQGSSSHKESERAEKSERDIGREKSSRSKAQSSRTNHHKNERISSTSHDKHRSATPTKLREHKKSTTTSKQQHTNIDTKYCDPVMSTTHGKNSPIISEQHYHQNAHHQNGTHENHHVHSMTKATIAAKQRESRSGKDRK